MIRLLGDFDRAEDALQEAFRAAVETWPDQGLPANPRAWLVSTGRFKAIDAIRRQARLTPRDFDQMPAPEPSEPAWLRGEIEDDRLRLIFTCCHPLLPAEARIALTLREVCGLSTEAIAAVHFTTVPTLAQRIVRAKARIRDAKIPFEVPPASEMGPRLETVLQVVYLVVNEGYSASSGSTVLLTDLTDEAVRLGRLLVRLLPAAEALGLLALMLLQQARLAARTTSDGEVILLEDQDRSLWNRESIREGTGLVRAAMGLGRPGAYTLQAAIAAVHASAPSTTATDWTAIVDLYDRLFEVVPSPVVALNRAVAVSMKDGPAAGLTLVDSILEGGVLADYHQAHSTRGELCLRAGLREEAQVSFQRALDLAEQEPERRLLKKKLESCRTPAASAD